MHFTQNEKQKFEPVLMTGVQPTGVLHIGNYLGAIKQTVKMQNSGNYKKVVLSIVDLHSVSVPQNPESLKLIQLFVSELILILIFKFLIERRNIFNNACSLLACGLDHPDTILFQQSSVCFNF